MLSGSHVFLAGSLLAEGKSLTASSQCPHSSPMALGVVLLWWFVLGCSFWGFLWFPRRGGRSTARAEARAVRQAEPPARVQRFPASALLPLGDDGCSDKGMRLLRGLSSLQREGKVMSLCIHTCVHVCMCVLTLRVSTAGPRGRACVGLSRCHRKVLQRDWEDVVPGRCWACAARMEGAEAVSLVLHPGQGFAVPQGCPDSCAGP